jgi:hypothetical protein
MNLRRAIVAALAGVALTACVHVTVVKPFVYDSPRALVDYDGQQAIELALKQVRATLYQGHGFSVLGDDLIAADIRPGLSCQAQEDVVQCRAQVLPILAYAAAAMIMADASADDGLMFGAEIVYAQGSGPLVDVAPSDALAETTWEILSADAGLPEKHYALPRERHDAETLNNILRSPVVTLGGSMDRQEASRRIKSFVQSSVPGALDDEHRLFRAALRYLVLYVIGHELFHASGECAIEPDPDIDRTAARLIDLQATKVPCAVELHRDVLNPYELLADRCAARGLRRLAQSASYFQLEPALDQRAREIAYAVVSVALPRGLGGQFSFSVQYEGGGAPEPGCKLRLALGLCERDCWQFTPAPNSAQWCADTCSLLPDRPDAGPPDDVADPVADAGPHSAFQEFARPLYGGYGRQCPDPLQNPTADLEILGKCVNRLADTRLTRAKEHCVRCSMGLSGERCDDCDRLSTRVQQTTEDFDALPYCIKRSWKNIIPTEPELPATLPQGYPFPSLRLELAGIAMGLKADEATPVAAQKAFGRHLCRAAAACSSRSPVGDWCREAGGSHELVFDRWLKTLR